MGSRPSNFSEIAYKRSKANDKKVAYNQKAAEFGAGYSIDARTLSQPVMSGVIDGNKIVVRQYGESDEPAGYWYDKNGEQHPWYATLGVETILEAGDDGVIRPSKEHVPRYIRFKNPPAERINRYKKIPKSSFEGNKYDLAREWCKMVDGITSDVPNITTMPLINPEAKEAEDRENRLIDALDDAVIHADAGQIVDPKSTPDGSVDDIKKRLAGITVKNIEDTIVSDENVKNIEDSSFAAALCDMINKAKHSKETTRHILSSIARKY